MKLPGWGLEIKIKKKDRSMKLTHVSGTAIVTLRSHVIESEKDKPIIHDPMAGYCLERLEEMLSGGNMDQLFRRKLSRRLSLHIAIRARKYDRLVNDYIAENPGCTVINLGCGFDTRYWRIDHRDCEYLELDLPEVIEIKKKVLQHKLEYELMAGSVLDNNWIENILAKTGRKVLFIAEGLFMYLDKKAVMGLFRTISERFRDSRMILEVVTEKYTRGLRKKMVVLKMKRELGLDAGAAYNFGIRNAAEIETCGDGIKVLDEWSYFEDPDTRPRIYRYMGLSRIQWTVILAINELHV